jgi:hypothetical protein
VTKGGSIRVASTPVLPGVVDVVLESEEVEEDTAVVIPVSPAVVATPVVPRELVVVKEVVVVPVGLEVVLSADVELVALHRNTLIMK